MTSILLEGVQLTQCVQCARHIVHISQCPYCVLRKFHLHNLLIWTWLRGTRIHHTYWNALRLPRRTPSQMKFVSTLSTQRRYTLSDNYKHLPCLVSGTNSQTSSVVCQWYKQPDIFNQTFWSISVNYGFIGLVCECHSQTCGTKIWSWQLEYKKFISPPPQHVAKVENCLNTAPSLLLMLSLLCRWQGTPTSLKISFADIILQHLRG